MSTYCRRHVEELAAGRCRSCQNGYCMRCLVYSFGPSKPPYCIGCAIEAGGVRTTGSRARTIVAPDPSHADLRTSPFAAAAPEPVDRRVERRIERAYRRAEKAAAKAAERAARKAGGSAPPPVNPGQAPSSQVPAPSSLRSPDH